MEGRRDKKLEGVNDEHAAFIANVDRALFEGRMTEEQAKQCLIEYWLAYTGEPI